ncbi:4-hydroxy-tetrahydrodipicolinate reductase [Helicobacter zhangjianzhongii]|uniref:4-hydroxy-tetrahydrodipicolinate reductase n=1 Tax=Helicobacter zhangjianzhongii TaxID=2974574 RepID=A0ACC6FSY8_9HELI|nr:MULTISPECIES: 4-hydroxy-tetrahydrodipicolinate reductase [unclassified Helicobacter]MDL0079704.1 4-hydroxy-tetrahydrodipicolinate reductase [Helicobacter sp. CPD2-1]MDL0082202.1 4-hydroxy-tetrahydrodipicolinate reductase [Helicobacter sp. XJK30-2]
MIKVGIFGASGRVGQLIIQEAKAHRNIEIGAVFVRKELDFSLPEGSFVTNDFNAFIQCCDVIIDFSSKEATNALLQALESSSSPVPCVIGTTGLDEQDFALIDSCSKRVPMLYASNMSLGIAVLRQVVEQVAAKLTQADIEISEIHHRYKKDAPSGTALSLAESCAKGRNRPLKEILVTDRISQGARKDGELSIISLRGGDVAGRHCVGFYLDGEYLELTHNATNRLTFAKGALACAIWLANKPPKLYEIDEVFA